MKPNQQRGVALVITLIMLSVITFLAVAFLALTRRDKASVNVSLTQTDARFMADTALARAEAEIVSRIIATTNILNYELLSTRNYIAGGFLGGEINLLNVNYDLAVKTGDPDDKLINIYNLFYDARPPVYVKTNETGPLDFRFYLDFNRNGRFDTNGLQVALDDGGQPIPNSPTNYVWGDPEWIGVLEKPQYRHSPTNRFIGRYAFFALPEGKSLDINFMHNYAKGNGTPGLSSSMPTGGDGFLRNQGVGSWELNLAAFLQDLNYGMQSNDIAEYKIDNSINEGAPFDDALDILRYRYRTNHTAPNLPSAESTLGFPGIAAVANDLVDGYANGPLLTNAWNFTNDNDLATQPWPGSKNPQAYRDVQELLDINKTSVGLNNRLRGVMLKSNSYDSQTFTRLLSQLGTTSDTNNYYIIAGKRYPKIHLNYDNLTPNTDGFASQTNLFEWEPLNFFTNVAEALIQQSLNRTDPNNHQIGGLFVGTDFRLDNIMVYPTNRYTPTVHRLLQLAANIHSARTNGLSGVGLSNYPAVFRPQFSKKGTDIFITGYEEVTTNGLELFEQGFTNLNLVAGRNMIATFPAKSQLNIVGIPWVVSARKGLPNFNEFSFETVINLTRKMELVKPNADPTTKPTETNLMYVVGITNYMGAEFWNSYTNPFYPKINVRFTNFYQAALTNQIKNIQPLVKKTLSTFGIAAVLPPSGTGPSIESVLTNRQLNVGSFLVKQGTAVLLQESTYSNTPPTSPSFVPVELSSFQSGQGLYVPDWDLLITNRVTALITEVESGRVLDFVNLGDSVTHIDINKALLGPDAFSVTAGANGEEPLVYALWNTNLINKSTPARGTIGMLKQIDVSLGEIPPGNLWDDYSPKTRKDITVAKQIDQFRQFMGGLTPKYGSVGLTPTNRMQVPFSPTRAIYIKSDLQANDPLVHYMLGDLVEPGKTDIIRAIVPPTKSYGGKDKFSENNLWQINDRYSPWGGNRVPGESAGSGGLEWELTLKDPLVRWSDDWDFPTTTNKFPNVGWLGRVHRGTPWQTVYLKSAVAKNEDWVKWAGSADTHPTRDWTLLDIFTAAPNDNAARGHLSVNQTNLASWSAALSGVLVLSNSFSDADLNALTPPRFAAMTIEPTSAQLSNIVDGINRTRSNFPGGVFTSVGQVLATPELTTNSLFLNRSSAKQTQYGLNDAAYERIPQQILSLLKVGQPRVAIYAYGQALRPAQNSIVLNAPQRYLQNLCTNYQIAGEVVTKTVLRVEGTAQNPKAVVESFEIISED